MKKGEKSRKKWTGFGQIMNSEGICTGNLEELDTFQVLTDFETKKEMNWGGME